MHKLRVILNPFQLIFHNLLHLRLDAVVVLLYFLPHTVVTIGIGEVGDDGNRLIPFRLGRYFSIVYDNLGMKNLLLDALVKVIRHRADEHSLCQSRNLTRWYEGVLSLIHI